MNIIRKIISKDLIMVALFVAILTIIIVPLGKTLLDAFLVVSLSLSLLILLISLYIQKPADLTTIPTLILVLALFRLSLNIATTRSILSEGHKGPEAVSDIIASFGDFVVGGNIVIGIIVFIILVLINFMVITKGATRVAEVRARFSLDSLPGKQMAIDADLNAGHIDENQARERRAELASESEFYGAMDGSSKFVKGDAVAGIIITLVNLIGGLLIGMFQHGLTAAESGHIYTILTIGDGLVAQIPALVLSTATAIIITRSNMDTDDFASGSVRQLTKDSKSLMFVGLALFLFALLPGFPSGVLMMMGLLFFFTGYIIQMISEGKENFFTKFFSVEEKPEIQAAKVSQQEKMKKQKILKGKKDSDDIETIMKMEILELKLGLRLLKLVQSNEDLLDKLKGIRKQIASELGFIIPQIKIEDDTGIEQNKYSINLKRIPVATGEVYVGKFLAMGGVGVERPKGIHVKEPVFDLDATWINEDQKEDVMMKGFTVVDAPTIISTHLSEVIKRNAEEIITRQDIVNLIDGLKKDFPMVVDEALKIINYGLVLNVCKNLLHEGVPIIDMLTILEAIVDVSEYSKNIETVTEHVRAKLHRLITAKFQAEDGYLHLITLKPDFEQKLIGKIQDQHGMRSLRLNIGEMSDLINKTKELMEKIELRGVSKIVLVVEPGLRKLLADIYERFSLKIAVLSHAELDPKTKFTVEEHLEL
jgi:flagellar biosynthesis protein FlhA